MSNTQKKEEARFRDHVRRLSVRSFPSNHDGFDDELTELGRIDQRVRSNLDEFYTGSMGSSMAKNRFDDVKPNEQTIVRMRPVSKRGDGTYINANYIDAREAMGVPFIYIATQAPMHNTVLDFWRMVYENDVAFIVMLCGVKENGKVKSEMYWPARGQVYDLGLLSVATLSENARSDSVHRTLLLRTIRGDEKEVYHMQYLAWPDQGIPTTSIPLMEMIQAIGKSRRSVESPIVVHCSGGIGRTGVFIGMHIALAQFQLERTEISIMRIVRFMKLCRSGMVQRKDQYIFLHYAVQREMERMILSAERGVNLLDMRPRDRPIPTQFANDAADGQGWRIAQPTHHGLLAPAGMHPLPEANHNMGASVITNLFQSTGPMSRERLKKQQRLQRQQEYYHQAATGGKRGSTSQHRDVAADMAAMEDYLQRNPSMRRLPRVGFEDGERTGGGSPPRQIPMITQRPGDGTPLALSADRGRHSATVSPQRIATTPQRQDRPITPATIASTAAQAKLEAELLRIQGINRQMRTGAIVGITGCSPVVAAPPTPSPDTRAVTPLSITREEALPPRPRASTPRIAMTTREWSRPQPDDDLAFLQRRLVTRDEWRRL